MTTDGLPNHSIGILNIEAIKDILGFNNTGYEILEKFPWRYLSLKGVGTYPGRIRRREKFQKNNDVNTLFHNLHIIGYRYLKKNFRKKIIKNFQRRYRQNRVNGILDSETLKISEILAKNSNIT